MINKTILHGNASKKAFDFFKNWIFGIWLLMIVFDPISLIAQLPSSDFQSIGFLLKFFSQETRNLFVTAPFLVFLKYSLIGLLVLLLLRKFTKIAGIAFCLLLTLFQEIVRGYGYPSHRELPLLFAVYIIVLFDITGSQSGKNEDKNVNFYATPIVAVTLVFALTYMLTAIRRLVYGGIDIYFTDSVLYWIIQNAHAPKAQLIWKLDHLVIEHAWLQAVIKLGFPLYTIAELGAPFCLLIRPLRYLFIVTIFIFHIFNWVFMGIFFWENTLMLILFLDFTQWFKSKN